MTSKENKVKSLLETVLLESNAVLDKNEIAKGLILKVKRALEQENLKDFESLKKFIKSWLQELDNYEDSFDDSKDKQGNPMGKTQVNGIAYILLNTPAYKRILDQFEEESDFSLVRKISITQEVRSMDPRWSKNMNELVPMHKNSTQKKGKVLKEEEIKSTDAFEVFDEVRKNLQDAQSALVISIPNKYQTLYQDELAGLYDEMASVINKVLNLTKKMKSELQQ